jgi:transcription elongation factor Elf1
MSYQDFWFDGWMRDQASLSQTWFTCQVCEQQLGVAEKARNGYTDCCKPCAEEIERDMQEMT